MNLLAIETSGHVGGVALARDGVLLAERRFEKGMEHGRLLVQTISDLCAEVGTQPAELDVVAVSQGPGSFTGLRVGIVCAKTLAFATGARLVAVCSFDALARNAPDEAGLVCTCLDAKRGDVYFGLYRRGRDGLARAAGPAVGRPAEVAAALECPAWVLGDGARVHAEAFRGDGMVVTPPETWAVRPAVVAMLGEMLAKRSEFADPASLTPIYLRRPEAEEKRLAGR